MAQMPEIALCGCVSVPTNKVVLLLFPRFGTTI